MLYIIAIVFLEVVIVKSLSLFVVSLVSQMSGVSGAVPCGPLPATTLSLFGTLSMRPRSRKEVFQPHLPVRLPCYDLAPVTSIALGRSLRKNEVLISRRMREGFF